MALAGSDNGPLNGYGIGDILSNSSQGGGLPIWGQLNSILDRVNQIASGQTGTDTSGVNYSSPFQVTKNSPNVSFDPSDPNYIANPGTRAPVQNSIAPNYATVQPKPVKVSVTVAGQSVPLTFKTPPSPQDLQDAQMSIFKSDHPDLYNDYQNIVDQMHQLDPRDPQWLDLNNQRHSLVTQGKAVGTDESDSTNPGWLANSMQFGTDMAHIQSLLHPEYEQARQAASNLISSAMERANKYSPLGLLATGIDNVAGTNLHGGLDALTTGLVNVPDWSGSKLLADPGAYADQVNKHLDTGDLGGFVGDVAGPANDALMALDGLGAIKGLVEKGIATKGLAGAVDHAPEMQVPSMTDHAPTSSGPPIDYTGDHVPQASPIGPSPERSDIDEFLSHPDQLYPYWREKTQGYINDINKVLEEGNIGSGKRQGLKAMRQELTRSLASDTPHPGIVEEYRQMAGTPGSTVANDGTIPSTESEPVSNPSNAEASQYVSEPSTSGTTQTPQEAVESPTANQAQNSTAPDASASAPVQTTGISNAVHLSEAEQGIIERAPDPQGRSANAIYEANRNRADYLNIADEIGQGKRALNADNTAALVAGKQKLLQIQNQARQALEDAVANGADEHTVRNLTDQYKNAQNTLQNYVENIQVGKAGWSDVGRVLAKDVGVDTGNVEDSLLHARINKGVDASLDPKTEKLITDQANKISELNDRLSDLEAKQEMVKQQRQSSGAASGGRKVKIAELDTAFNDLSKQFMAKAGTLNSGINPDLIPIVGKMVANRIERGALTVAEAIQPVLEVLRQHFPDVTERDVKDAYSGYAKQNIQQFPPTAGEESAQRASALKSQMRNESKLEDLQNGVTPPKRAPREPYSKEIEDIRRQRDDLHAKQLAAIRNQKPLTITSRLKQWVQTNVLSGPGTLGNLAAYSVGALPSSAVEDFAGKALGKVLPEAGTEVIRGPGHEIAGVQAMLSKDTVQSAKQALSGGANFIKAEAIQRGLENELSPKSALLQKMVNIHAAEKTPLQTYAFAKEYQKQLDLMANKGITPTPDRLDQAWANAYKKSKEAILMNDNLLSQRYGQFVRGTAAEPLSPVIKVPSNFLGRQLEYTGLPAVKGFADQVASAIKKEPLAAERQAEIARAYKRGGVGLGLATLAYNLPKSAASVDDQGNLIIAGHKMYSPVNHIIPVEMFKAGLRARDKGVLPAAMQTMGDVLNHIPFKELGQSGFDLINNLRKGEGGEKAVGKAIGQTVAGIAIPQLISQPTRQLDFENDPNLIQILTGQGKAVDRSPQDGLDEVRMNFPGHGLGPIAIPGLGGRADVPTKGEAKMQQSLMRKMSNIGKIRMPGMSLR